MAYQMNIFLVLAKSLMKTPEIIMKTRSMASEERDYQLDAIKYNLPNGDAAKLKQLNDLVVGMKKDYKLYEHYKYEAPMPLPADVVAGLNASVSRLTVVAHGDPLDSSFIQMDGGDPKVLKNISAQVLRSWVRTFLASAKIERISLHICYSARHHPPSPNFVKGAVPFALAFARNAGDLATSVSARTGSVTTEAGSGNRVTSETEHGIHYYRQSEQKKIYSTGEEAAEKPYNYSDKNARDKLVAELFENLKTESQKAAAAEFKNLFN